MARKYGRCANYGECSLADSHKVIDATDDNFVCPECAKPLRPTSGATDGGANKKTGGVAHWLLPLAFIVLLLGGMGVFAWQWWSARTVDTTQTAASQQTTVATATSATIPQPPPSPSVIKSTPTLDVNVGDKIDYTVITEPQADKVTADRLPEGVELDEASGKLTGTIMTAGEYKLQLYAETNGQMSAPFSLIVTVKPKESSPNIILRLHGSNTIGAKLAPALVETFLQEKGYTDIQKVPLANLEVLIQGKKAGTTQVDAIEIKSHGSSTAFDETEQNKQVGLLGGYADIGMSSSPVKAEVIKKFEARGLGSLGSKQQEHIVALDGLAVIVHPSNTLEQLTVEQIRKIFLGEINDWAEVGGKAGVIKRYARDQQSGTYDSFKHMVLSGKKLDCGQQANLQCFEDSKELAASVVSDMNGIGFIGLNYISTAKPLKISRSAGVSATAPNRFTVKTEDYPLSRRLFLYQTNQPKLLAAEFIQFALSNVGQKVVNATGLVEVGIEEKIPDDVIDAEKQRLLDNPAIPQSYKDLILHADRKDTPFNFRFASGQADLDNRAFRDIGRLVEKLGRSEFADAKLILIGFADPKGDAVRNLALSKERAIEVQQALASDGIKVYKVDGFGEEPALLLDTAENDESLAKNRRVEVWLQRSDATK